MALALCRQYSALVLRPLELKPAVARFDARTGQPNPVGPQERAGRVAAALHELDQAIRWACAKHGTALLERAAPAVECCAHCGAPVPQPQAAGTPAPCSRCGGVVDDLHAGAARTWQHAIEGIEARIIDFHAAASRARAEQAQLRQVRLGNMARNRLPRRPRGGGGPGEAGRA